MIYVIFICLFNVVVVSTDRGFIVIENSKIGENVHCPLSVHARVYLCVRACACACMRVDLYVCVCVRIVPFL